MRALRAAAAMVAIFLGSLAAHAETLYTITDLGPLGTVNDGLRAAGLNNTGDVVGYTEERAFLWRGGLMTDLGTLPGRNRSQAFDVNNSGQVVGWSYKYTSWLGVPLSVRDGRAFLWESGQMTDLGTLPVFSDPNDASMATGINDQGRIVGSCGETLILGGLLYVPQRAFVRRGGTMQALNDLIPPGSSWDLTYASAINNSGDIVGSTFHPGAPDDRAYLFREGSVTDLGRLGGDSASATDINNVGQVVGYSDSVSGSDVVDHPFLWEAGMITDLGTLSVGSSPQAYATAVNASTVVVGRAYTPSAGDVAWVWLGGTICDLNGLIPPDSDWQLAYAADINDLGQIVGYGSHKIGGQWYERAFILTPIPEPGTLGMLLVGGLAIVRRRPHRPGPVERTRATKAA